MLVVPFFLFLFFPLALEDPFAFCPFSFLLGHTPRILAPRGGVISPQEVIPNRGFFFFPLSVPCLSPFFFLFLDLGDCLYWVQGLAGDACIWNLTSWRLEVVRFFPFLRHFCLAPEAWRFFCFSFFVVVASSFSHRRDWGVVTRIYCLHMTFTLWTFVECFLGVFGGFF